MSSQDLSSKLTEHGLTIEEDLKCDHAFAAFDKDESGYIDAKELGIVLEMMGQKKREEDIYGMISEVVEDRPVNSISLDEFKRVIGE